MITIIEKDITTVEHGIVAHGVNCRGVMGSGVAKAIRDKWPQVYTQYKAYCNTLLYPSEALSNVQTVDITSDLVVANCFTQEKYGNDGKQYADPAAIRESIESLFDYARVYNLPIYLPKIGCGLGGLSWQDDIGPMIFALHDYLTWNYDHCFEVYVCEK